jgi:hypothetical protein
MRGLSITAPSEALALLGRGMTQSVSPLEGAAGLTVA